MKIIREKCIRGYTIEIRQMIVVDQYGVEFDVVIRAPNGRVVDIEFCGDFESAERAFDSFVKYIEDNS